MKWRYACPLICVTTMLLLPTPCRAQSDLGHPTTLDVTRYGARGDGETDDTGAIQRVLTGAHKLLQTAMSAGATYRGIVPTVYLPPGTYLVSRPLTFYTYTRIVGDDAVFITTPDFPDDRFVLSGNGWQSEISGLQFDGVPNGIRINTENLDQGLTQIDNCKFFGVTGVCLEIDARSSIVNITNCKFDRNAHVLNQVRGDHVNLKNSWISQRPFTKNRDASITVRSGILHVTEVVGVPGMPEDPATMYECAYINMVGDAQSVVLTRVRFGGEPGSMAAVNCFVRGDTTYPVLPKAIIIKESQLYQVRPNGQGPFPGAVRLFAVPNQIILRDNRGFVDSYTMVWGEGVDPAAAIEGFSPDAGGNNPLVVRVDGNVGGRGGGDYVLPELRPFTGSDVAAHH